jgi:UDP-N-acetylmuramate dehydrogenase
MVFEENKSLKELANYRIGGPARYFFEAHSAAELKLAVKEAKRRNLPIFILGGGTNLLISDSGFNGLVLRPAISFLRRRGISLEAGAGVSMAELLEFNVAEALSGLEWAGGLPGTLGGAIRGNAGAFGGEIKDNISSVRALDLRTLKMKEYPLAKCGFNYRSSIFKKHDGQEIILSAKFSLNRGDPKEIKKAVDEKIAYRVARHPMDYPNVGSIFKNVPLERIPKKLREQFADVVKHDPIPVVPTARLITKAGLKGLSYGGAMISPKHANFIVNVCDAQAADVRALIALVKNEVKKKFDVDLEEEIRYV